MQAMVGYDKNCAPQFVNGWNDCRVTINGITFKVKEDVIEMATRLSMKEKNGRRLQKWQMRPSCIVFWLYYHDSPKKKWHTYIGMMSLSTLS